MNKLLTVKHPIANLVKAPEDPAQETQLLLGESLLGSEVRGDWVRVHAPQQPYYSAEGGWSGYPGWVKAEDVLEVSNSQADSIVVKTHGARLLVEGKELLLSIGTCLEVEEEEGEHYWIVELPDGSFGKIRKGDCVAFEREVEDGRSELTEYAKTFLNMPYQWGGMSSYLPDYPVSSVDCSGLTYLVHKLLGIIIPRNAHDQYMRALKLDSVDLQEGDLIFTAKKENKDRITHVMIYMDDETLLESTSAEGIVRVVDTKEKLGVGLRGLDYGAEGPKNFIFFGTFL